jgi:hypothetical protein
MKRRKGMMLRWYSSPRKCSQALWVALDARGSLRAAMDSVSGDPRHGHQATSCTSR